MRYTIVMICLLFVFDAIGQKKKVLEKLEAELIEEQSQWYVGNVQLWVDSSSISGLVQFNDKMQTLKFKMEEGQPESLTPEEVRKFEFFDNKKQTLRSFISVDYPVVNSLIGEQKVQRYSVTHDQLGTTTKLEFLEIIDRTRGFLLLSKTSPIQLIQSKETNAALQARARNVNRPGVLFREVKNELGQEVTLLFFDDDVLYPAIRVTKIETKKATKDAKNGFFNNFIYDKNTDIQLDEKLLFQMTGRYFPKIQEYIKDNKLDRNSFEDLIKIIEYFKQLEDKG